MFIKRKYSLSLQPRPHSDGFKKDIIARYKSILLLLIFVPIVTVLPILQPTNANAITTSDSQGPNSIDWQIKSLLYYKAIATCMRNANLEDTSSGVGIIKPSSATSGNWFSNKSIALGVYMEGTKNGMADCDNKTLPFISGALSLSRIRDNLTSRPNRALMYTTKKER